MRHENSPNVRRIYYSKKDRWMVTLFWVVVCGMVGAAFVLAGSQELPTVLRIALPVMLVLAADVMLWTLYGTRYVLTDTDLRVRSGPFRMSIPYAEIQQVSPSRSALAAPACSLDRLLITGGRFSTFGLLISPERKLEFLKDLVSLSPVLRLEDERIIRVPA